MRGRALAIAVVLVVIAALVSWRAFGRGSVVAAKESYSSGDVVGFQLDRAAEPAVVAALDKMTQSAQWLACVPAIQLEKVAREQVRTGVSTIKASEVLETMKTRKNAAPRARPAPGRLADIQERFAAVRRIHALGVHRHGAAVHERGRLHRAREGGRLSQGLPRGILQESPSEFRRGQQLPPGDRLSRYYKIWVVIRSGVRL